MINPVLSNFRIDFGEAFFPETICTRYNNFLFYKNYPFKSVKGYVQESIQNLETPGVSLQTLSIAGLANNKNFDPANVFKNIPNPQINKHFPGTSPINDIIDANIVTITFRNSILNYMYLYEVLRSYYNRKRLTDSFYIMLTMMDSAEIPILRIKFEDCFVSVVPGLSFGYNQSFNETKTFDCGFIFNKFNIDFIVPDFNIKKITL